MRRHWPSCTWVERGRQEQAGPGYRYFLVFRDKDISIDSISLSNILNDLRHIIDTARNNAVRSVDFCRVRMYWELGQRIVDEEQQGLARAQYGSYLLKNLAHKLEGEYGSGFSLRQLERARQFYRAYPIASALRSQLNWSQYKMLISIEDKDKREYYECESVNNAWTG